MKNNYFALGILGVGAVLLFRKPAPMEFSEVSDLQVSPRGDDISYSVKDFIVPTDGMSILIEHVGEEGVAGLLDVGSYTLTCQKLVVDNISYEEDIGWEYWKFPSETWADKKADCEDTSFLLTSLLRNAVDAQVAAGIFTNGIQEWGHAWVVVKIDGNSYVLESTLSSMPENPWVTEEEFSDNYIPYIYWNENKILVREGYEMFLMLTSMANKKEAIDDLWRVL